MNNKNNKIQIEYSFKSRDAYVANKGGSNSGGACGGGCGQGCGQGSRNNSPKNK